MEVGLNWFVQGVIVAIVTAVTLRFIPRSRAQARYGVLWTAYLLVLALPTVPIVLAIALEDASVDLVPAAANPVVTMPTTWWASSAAALGLWMVWSCIQAVRLAMSALGVRNARRLGRECPASVLARLPYWSRVSVTGRRARVILSGEVRAAAVLGCGTATIALAPTLIGRLSVADLDRVLVHEWAHLQRRDDLAQLAQRFVAIGVGWHPAAWWLERQLEFEREAACDEIVVSVTGSAKGYATCLATLAALPEARLRAVAALAAASPCRIRGRIVRILAAPSADAARPWRAIAIGGGGGLLACTLVVANLQLVASDVTSAVAATAPYLLSPEPAVRDRLVTFRSEERAESGPSAPEARRRRSPEHQRPAAQEARLRVDVPSTPLPASAWPRDLPTLLPAVTDTTERPVQSAGSSELAPVRTASTEPRAAEQTSAPWTRAADAGVNIGRASQTAGTATAGFFRRFGGKIAAAF